ncbi:hypothetical protein GIB67_005608 [Kingdonia uniflora]|uniref:Micro-fibrillar-associated protein 1 C-terminal domain-containing protein n=1 Tax=Kingdonia uniflora TaxID=39325 RepID=A0A7J7NID1_9MAGN|nr:hypothetical protein GIB67_005608 [Kingdonia uniflora]
MISISVFPQITTIKRYWSGKAPNWAIEEIEKEINLERRDDIVRKNDQRLGRLAQIVADNMEEIKEYHRRIIEEEEADEESLEEKRRITRENLLHKLKDEAALLPELSEEESEGSVIRVADRERAEAEERVLEDLVKRKKEERKIEMKRIVVGEIQKDLEIKMNMEVKANVEDIDMDDEFNEAEEYEAWKLREFMRIKRGRDDSKAILKEKEEIKRVRIMTEEERRNPKPLAQSKEKVQKYYHKGAFFQDKADDRSVTARMSDTIRLVSVKKPAHMVEIL